MSGGTGKPRVLGVIPARYGSTRLPGKSLLSLCGKPLVQWVYERVMDAGGLDEVCIATDDERIAEVARSFGAEVVMTREDHPSGTDRIAEAVAGREVEVVVNIQGDEPLIEPDLIDQLVARMLESPAWDMATAAAPITQAEEYGSPAVVKVVWGGDGQALYFSREPIPHIRDRKEPGPTELHWRHIGIYAYRKTFLDRLVGTPQCPLEVAEKLEQLRALHIGGRIAVIQTRHSGLGVDTPEDVPRAEAALRALYGM
ncbi:MAG TPA: 3-deoxy-manno-octulosonate cytidylyltransferase [Kiritimatiellia bacterium]|nr:3-deoxy-manno-octulosonate cytidylyltransferase [Kiritimatiellia bacterium]